MLQNIDRFPSLQVNLSPVAGTIHQATSLLLVRQGSKKVLSHCPRQVDVPSGQVGFQFSIRLVRLVLVKSLSESYS